MSPMRIFLVGFASMMVLASVEVRAAMCTACSGTGQDPNTFMSCTPCGGTGQTGGQAQQQGNNSAKALRVHKDKFVISTTAGLASAKTGGGLTGGTPPVTFQFVFSTPGAYGAAGNTDWGGINGITWSATFDNVNSTGTVPTVSLVGGGSGPFFNVETPSIVQRTALLNGGPATYPTNDLTAKITFQGSWDANFWSGLSAGTYTWAIKGTGFNADFGPVDVSIEIDKQAAAHDPLTDPWGGGTKPGSCKSNCSLSSGHAGAPGTCVVGGTCFLAGTQIAMADPRARWLGRKKHQAPLITRNIEDIFVGDHVKAFDETTGQVVDSRVTHVFVHPDTRGYYLINDNLRVTGEHPMWVLDGSGPLANSGAWVEVEHLVVGDRMLHLNGSAIEVRTIQEIDEVVTTYNFEVAKVNTYFADGHLCHNQKVIPEPKGTLLPGTPQMIATGTHPNTFINHRITRLLQPKTQVPGKFNQAEPRNIMMGNGNKLTFKTKGSQRLGLRGGIQIIPVSKLPPMVVKNPSLITPNYPGGNVGSVKPLTGVAPPSVPRLTSKPAMTSETAQKQNVKWNAGRSGGILLYRPTGFRMGSAKKKKRGGRVMSRRSWNP